MEGKEYLKDNQVFIFELDNVIYPEKDYLLQVYYLFAQFIEYTEQIDAQEIIRFMQETYHDGGETDIFFKTAGQFNFPEKYKVNFDLLQQHARLPLKLLLYAPVLSFMQQILTEGRKLFLLADGDPVKQLNKIRQIEWNGIEQDLRVYFTEEIAEGAAGEAVDIMLNQHALDGNKTVFVGREEKIVFTSGIKFLPVDKLLVP